MAKQDPNELVPVSTRLPRWMRVTIQIASAHEGRTRELIWRDALRAYLKRKHPKQIPDEAE